MNDDIPGVIELTGRKGMQVQLLNYGATLQKLLLPHPSGKAFDIVLGYNDPKKYLSSKSYFGATVGRYANRIRNGHLNIKGQTYQLSKNHGNHHLHGGFLGLSAKIWDFEKFRSNDGEGVRFTLDCKDGQEGYPGNLCLKTTYTALADNCLRIEYEATTDKTTVVNLTNHSYFNLSSQCNTDILDHKLQLFSRYFTSVDHDLIPTGEFTKIDDTPMDFRSPKFVKKCILSDASSLNATNGLDHNFVICRDRAEPGGMVRAACLSTLSGPYVMEVWTTQPGMQVYTANHLESEHNDKAKKPFKAFPAICFETQHYPDSPNHSHFPSTTLEPWQRYYQKTEFRFFKNGW